MRENTMENFYIQIKNIVSELPKFDKIVILANGDSANDLEKSSLENSFIINVNDSEKAIAGNIGLIGGDWVIKSLSGVGFNLKHYIGYVGLKNTEAIKRSRLIEVDRLDPNNNEFDELQRVFEDNVFVITSNIFVSGIKLAKIINQIVNRNNPIYLLGFDFENTSNLNKYALHTDSFRRTLFEIHKYNLGRFLNYLNSESRLKVVHVGSLNFSELSIDEFKNYSIQAEPECFDNKREYQNLINELRNPDSSFVLKVAELTNNHLGDDKRLREMIKQAKNAGFNMIKVQKRDVETFYTDIEKMRPYTSPYGVTLEDYRNGVELTDSLMDVLIDQCAKSRIVWFSSVLDLPSLLFIQKYDPPLIKLPSTISNHKEYLLSVASVYSGDLVVSTGFTDINYEGFVLDNFAQNRILFMLQCTSSYPTPPEACQIGVVRHYSSLNSLDSSCIIYPGYSSHDVGSLGSMLALAAGARMIEKHVKLGDVEWVHFDNVALNLENEEAKSFIKDLELAQLMVGSTRKEIHYTEHHKYKPNGKAR
jgi:N-acetylneuraminate synthase